MFLLLVTKVVGFFKLRTLAELFGATHELDIFWAAFTIPDLLFTILVAGSINAALIPLFSDILHKKGQEALDKFFNRFSVVLSTFIILIASVLFIFTPQITSLLINNENAQQFLNFSTQLTHDDITLFVKLTRIMMLSPVLLGISTLITAYLQTKKQFFVTSLAPLFYNIAMMLFPYIFTALGYKGVEVVAISAVLGSLFHLVVQIPAFGKYFKEKFIINTKILKEGIKDKETKVAIRLALPRTISLLLEQINVVINTVISFSLQAGALSAYKFAVSLHQFPINIIGSAIAQTALPNLAETNEDYEKFKKVLNKSIQQALFLVFPLTGIMLVLRLPIVRLAYGTGAFDWNDTLLTAWCLALLSISIIGQTVVQILLRAFYALKETWKPLTAIIIGIIVNILCSYFITNFFSHYFDWRPILGQITSQLSDRQETIATIKSFFSDFFRWCITRGDSNMGVGGLTFALGAAYIVEMIVLTKQLDKKIHFVDIEENVKPTLKKLCNTLLMIIGMYLIYKLFNVQLNTSRTISIIILTMVTSIYGLLSYWVGAKVFGIPEVDVIERKIINMIRKIKVNNN